MQIDEFLELCDNVTPHPGGYKVSCPVHGEDSDPSLGVTEGDEGILLQCYAAGCSTTDICSALGIEVRDLFYKPRGGGLSEPQAIYSYEDETGAVRFEVCRYITSKGKTFKQRHYAPEHEDAKADGYVYNMDGIERLPYHLPQLLAGIKAGLRVWVVEGEKDVNSLEARGEIATCNPGGGGKWKPEYDRYFAGADVIIVADRDDVGRKHAEKVRMALTGTARGIWIMQSKSGKDATDHFDDGHDVGDFVMLREKVRRGVTTAKEMAARGREQMTAKTPEPEYIIPNLLPKVEPLAFRNGRMTTLGGYSGDGKTALQLQVTRYLMSGELPPKTGLFTSEMNEDDLRNRLVTHTGLPLYKVEHPHKMTTEERALYELSLAEIGDWPLEVIYDSGITADMIEEITHNREYDFVIFDHAHDLEWADRRGLEKEIRKLANLARDYNIPVLVLAQLRKNERGRDAKPYSKPTLQDFRETSMFENVSSLCLAIWRQRMEDGQRYDPNNQSQLLVLKNRYGRSGYGSMLRFDGPRQLFIGGNDDAQPGTEQAPDAGSPLAGGGSGAGAQSVDDWLSG